MIIEMKLTGDKRAREIFNKIPIAARDGARIGLHNSLKLIKMQASTILDSTSTRANPRGHGQRYGNYLHRKINSSWETEEPEIAGGIITSVLKNTSDHACYVEFGTGARSELTSADVAAKGNVPLTFRIGNRWISKWAVAGQMPKAYLRTAMIVHQRNIPRVVGDSIRIGLGI